MLSPYYFIARFRSCPNVFPHQTCCIYPPIVRNSFVMSHDDTFAKVDATAAPHSCVRRLHAILNTLVAHLEQLSPLWILVPLLFALSLSLRYFLSNTSTSQPSQSSSTSSSLSMLPISPSDKYQSSYSTTGSRHRNLYALLPTFSIPLKHLLWDSLLYPFLSWLFNLLSILLALLFALLQSTHHTLYRRNHIKVCVSSSSNSSAVTLATNPDATQSLLVSNTSVQHVEATHLSRRKSHSLSPYFSALMVPAAKSVNRRRKSLVLDLDETLVHSQFKPNACCDLRMEIRDDHYNAIFYVSKRPHLDVFLRTVAQWYNVVIFTASLQKYADPLISVLDVNRVVKRRIFRQDCIRRNGNFVKDITIVNPNLADVLIVDNSPAAYSMHPSNAIPIDTWYDDQSDDQLLNLLPLLHALAFLNDVRSLLDLRLTGGTLLARINHLNHSHVPFTSS